VTSQLTFEKYSVKNTDIKSAVYCGDTFVTENNLEFIKSGIYKRRIT